MAGDDRGPTRTASPGSPRSPTSARSSRKTPPISVEPAADPFAQFVVAILNQLGDPVELDSVEAGVEEHLSGRAGSRVVSLRGLDVSVDGTADSVEHLEHVCCRSVW